MKIIVILNIHKNTDRTSIANHFYGESLVNDVTDNLVN